MNLFPTLKESSKVASKRSEIYLQSLFLQAAWFENLHGSFPVHVLYDHNVIQRKFEFSFDCDFDSTAC